MQIRHFLAAVLLALTAFSALATGRPFPATAKPGVFSFESYPTVTLNDKECNLSAGLRIWNRNNLTQVPMSLLGSKFLANYTLDPMGQVNRIWILTAEEAQKVQTATSTSTTDTTTSTSSSTSSSSSTDSSSTTTGTQ